LAHIAKPWSAATTITATRARLRNRGQFRQAEHNKTMPLKGSKLEADEDQTCTPIGQ